MSHDMLNIVTMVAEELHIKPSQVESVIRLLDDGATVPFIARYRKEATEGLDDTQLRKLADRLYYLRDLNERKLVVLASIREQGKLTDVLEQHILHADTKNRLEDLYLPYRPKRRTKAQLAREAGLEPLALVLLQDPTLDPVAQSEQYVNVELGIGDAKSALEGARQILIEKFAEDAELINELREYLWRHAVVRSVGVSAASVTAETASGGEAKPVAAKSAKKSAKAKAKHRATDKYTDYLDYVEPIRKIPSHRALALFRGRREGVLQLSLQLVEEPDYAEQRVIAFCDQCSQQLNAASGMTDASSATATTATSHMKSITEMTRAADAWLLETARMAWRLRLLTKLESELFARLREAADEAAIQVFALNLRALLLNAPAGPKIAIGLDPGIRTGVKVVVVDVTGKLLNYTTIFPFAPQNEWHQSVAELAKLCAKYGVNLLSIGNGTGSRETDRLVADLMKMYPDLGLAKVLVSEAGASVYSASELAALEFPDLDVSLRGAVSIARRLQDPLAELVKIEPKAIGVGQYQHDVNQVRLANCLEGVVEDCVNAVGVDVNTASVPLLTHVAGLNESIAKNLVSHRDTHGAFVNRQQLKDVQRMGDKTFQQAAGFLRIMNGENPLDASAVHPEAYSLVEKISADQGIAIPQLIGNKALLTSINAAHYVSDAFGLPTVRDVLAELEKPGRDPRPEFKTVNFQEGVEEIKHLEVGMLLEGVVSNVTNFGAFIDIGVHQDGLVHISELKNGFVADPNTVIKAGEIVKVKVIQVDHERRRIGLSMKLETAAVKPAKSVKPEQSQTPVTAGGTVARSSQSAPKKEYKKPIHSAKKPATPVKKTIFNTSMADALAKLKKDL